MKKIAIILSALGLFSAQNISAQIAEKAEDVSPLLIGEKIPNVKVINKEGQSVSMKEVLSKKPTVLVFYRGGWCPYCNVQLSALAELEEQISNLGYQVVAISPESYENLFSVAQEDNVSYQLYSDSSGELTTKTGIAFQTSTIIKAYAKTKFRKGKVSDILPVPTVMVVDTNSEILFEYINPNYKVRLSAELLLSVLKTLSTK